jgi:hypothetical protein
LLYVVKAICEVLIDRKIIECCDSTDGVLMDGKIVECCDSTFGVLMDRKIAED